MMETKAFLNDIADSIRRTFSLYHGEIADLDQKTLLQKPAEESWSIIECLEHMNLAHKAYIKQMDDVLSKAGNSDAKKTHKSGWIARRSIRMMQPGNNRKIRWKMKTMSGMEPALSALRASEVLAEFTRQIQRMEEIAEQAQDIDISRPRIKTALGPLTFNFGDALAFIAAHAERHMVQACNTKKALLAQREPD